MVVQCTICKVECSTEQSYQSHVHGKKHQKVVSELEERKRQAKCSVFVRGFPRQTTEEDMREYFSRFGDVVQVIIEDKRDLFAFVEFAGVEAPARAMRQRRHFIGSHRVTVKQRIFRESTFRPHRYLTPPRRGPRGDRPTAAGGGDDPITHSEVTVALSGATSVLNQMERLCEHIRMTDEEIKMKRQLCLMLEEVLAPIFPGCTVHQFGSSVNGFGVRGCDADIFLDIREHEENQTEQHEIVKLPYIRDIPSLKKSYGPLTTADLDPMSLYDKVRLVSRILCERAPGCGSIIAIPSARCPVVRFVHAPTSIKCDISINNRIALKNSQLLWMYSCLDDRVRLLVYTVRYWAKVKDIAGSGTKLSNYALTFTVLYFLQNTAPPVLPSVEHLASLVPADTQDVINEWNCSFESDVSRLQQTSNQDSADELLRKYFEFYSDQDFSKTVFQTRTGRARSILEFLAEYETSGFKSPFKIGPVSVQDPFVLDHNITGNVNGEKKLKIAVEFTIAACKASKWPKNKSRKRSDADQGLVELLSDNIPPEIITRCSLPEGARHSFQIALKDTHLLRTVPASDRLPELASRLDWCGRVVRFTKQLLSEVLLVSVECLASAGEMVKESGDVQMDTDMSEQSVSGLGRLVSKESKFAPGFKPLPGFEAESAENGSLAKRKAGGLFAPEARKRHSTTSSEEMDVKKCCYKSQDDPSCGSVGEPTVQSAHASRDDSVKSKLNAVETAHEREHVENENRNLDVDVKREENVTMEIDSLCVDLDQECLTSHSVNVKMEGKVGMETECGDKITQTQEAAVEDNGKMEESVKMDTDSQCSIFNMDDNEMQRSGLTDEVMQDQKQTERNVQLEGNSGCVETDYDDARKSSKGSDLPASPDVQDDVSASDPSAEANCCSLDMASSDASGLKGNSICLTSCQKQDQLSECEQKTEVEKESPVDPEGKKTRKTGRSRKPPASDKVKSPKMPRKRSPEKDKGRSTQPTQCSAELEAIKTEFLCKIHCHTWQGRNRIRKSTLASSGVCDLNLERTVSQKIMEKAGPSQKALILFRCRLEPVVSLTLCVVNVSVVAMENHSECQAFVSYFKSFVNRMLDRYLNSETLGGPVPGCSKDVPGTSSLQSDGHARTPDNMESITANPQSQQNQESSMAIPMRGSPEAGLKMPAFSGLTFGNGTIDSSSPGITDQVPSSLSASFGVNAVDISDPSMEIQTSNSPASSFEPTTFGTSEPGLEVEIPKGSGPRKSMPSIPRPTLKLQSCSASSSQVRDRPHIRSKIPNRPASSFGLQDPTMDVQMAHSPQPGFGLATLGTSEPSMEIQMSENTGTISEMLSSSGPPTKMPCTPGSTMKMSCIPGPTIKMSCIPGPTIKMPGSPGPSMKTPGSLGSRAKTRGSKGLGTKVPQSRESSFGIKAFGTSEPTMDVQMTSSPRPSLEPTSFGTSEPSMDVQTSSGPGLGVKIQSSPRARTKKRSNKGPCSKIPNSRGPSFAAQPLVSSEPSTAVEMSSSPGHSPNQSGGPQFSFGVNTLNSSMPSSEITMSGSAGPSVDVPGFTIRIRGSPGLSGNVPGPSGKIRGSPGPRCKVKRSLRPSLKLTSSEWPALSVAGHSGPKTEVQPTDTSEPSRPLAVETSGSPGHSTTVTGSRPQFSFGVNSRDSSEPGSEMNTSASPGPSFKRRSSPGSKSKSKGSPWQSLKISDSQWPCLRKPAGPGSSPDMRGGLGTDVKLTGHQGPSLGVKTRRKSEPSTAKQMPGPSPGPSLGKKTRRKSEPSTLAKMGVNPEPSVWNSGPSSVRKRDGIEEHNVGNSDLSSVRRTDDSAEPRSSK